MHKLNFVKYKYEGKDFYNDYCSRLEDFILLEYFEDKSNEEGKSNEYVGKIATNNTIYPIEIEVHIPHNFPHRKMMFVTWSLSGYPHLIPFNRYDSSKGNWFCLNSAFAETPKAQLDEEFDRLRGWLRNNLRSDLQHHIRDHKTQVALQLFNAYEGDNPDEINELAKKSNLTFVGDFAHNSENFNELSGYLYVVRHPNDKFTVFQDKEGTNEKLPYVLVTHIPVQKRCFASWVDEFKWDKKLCESLLPGFHWREVCEVKSELARRPGEDSKSYMLRRISTFSDEEAEANRRFLKEQLSTVVMPDAHRKAVLKEVESLVEQNRILREYLNKDMGSIDDLDPEPDPMDLYYSNNSKLHYFAIGVVCDGSIEWFLASSNLYSREYDVYHYDLELYNYDVKEVKDIRMNLSCSNVIGKKEYFGRGELRSTLSEKRIAIIGLGAIGSSVAETLARGGASCLTLWDGDIVEAGNICRSIYDNADIGNAKAQALSEHLKRISPFCHIKPKGGWDCPNYTGVCYYDEGDFYGDINYQSQKTFIESLHEYDLIIDCTASNELLHFLSFAAVDVELLSLCITNRATHLLCLSNQDGSPFEMRKHILASIEQDTENFYVEGTGCYSPTFLATSCDIQSLVNLCVRSIQQQVQSQGFVSSTVWHYDGDNILADRFRSYQLDKSPIKMLVSESSICKMKHLPMSRNGEMGYILGGYNTNRNVIYITTLVDQTAVNETLGKIRKLSEGIIDYIGNVCVASHFDELPLPFSQQHIAEMARSRDIDTNNPIVATVKEDGNIKFQLYIGGEFVSFHLIDDKNNGKQ